MTTIIRTKTGIIRSHTHHSAEESKMRRATRYAQRLLRTLRKDHPTNLPINVVFKNTKRTYHMKRNGEHQLIFGKKLMAYEMENGFIPYQRLRWMIQYRTLTGLEAVAQIVLHEYAHCMQTEQSGCRAYGSVHNQCFVDCYKKLIDQYPFGTVAE